MTNNPLEILKNRYSSGGYLKETDGEKDVDLIQSLFINKEIDRENLFSVLCDLITTISGKSHFLSKKQGSTKKALEILTKQLKNKEWKRIAVKTLIKSIWNIDQELNEREVSFSHTDSLITSLFQKQKTKLENAFIKLYFETLCSIIEYSPIPTINSHLLFTNNNNSNNKNNNNNNNNNNNKNNNSMDEKTEGDQYSVISNILQCIKNFQDLSTGKSMMDRIWIINSLCTIFPNLFIEYSFHSVLLQITTTVQESDSWKFLLPLAFHERSKYHKTPSTSPTPTSTPIDTLDIYSSFFYSNLEIAEIFKVKEEIIIIESLSQKQTTSIIPFLSSILYSIDIFDNISYLLFALLIASSCPSLFKLTLNSIFNSSSSSMFQKDQKQERKLDFLMEDILIYLDNGKSKYAWDFILPYKDIIRKWIYYIIEIRISFLLFISSSDSQFLPFKKDMILASTPLSNSNVPLFRFLISLLQSTECIKSQSICYFIIELMEERIFEDLYSNTQINSLRLHQDWISFPELLRKATMISIDKIRSFLFFIFGEKATNSKTELAKRLFEILGMNGSDFIINSMLFYLLSTPYTSPILPHLSHYIFKCITLFTPFFHSLSLCMDLLESHLDHLITFQQTKEMKEILKLMNILLNIDSSFISFHQAILQKNGSLNSGFIGKLIKFYEHEDFEISYCSYSILGKIFDQEMTLNNSSLFQILHPSPNRIPSGGSTSNYSSSLYLTLDHLLALYFSMLSKLSLLIRNNEKYDSLPSFNTLLIQIQHTKKQLVEITMNKSFSLKENKKYERYGELIDQLFDFIFSNNSEQVIRPSISSKLLVHPSTSLIPPSPLITSSLSSLSIPLNDQFASLLDKSKSGDLDLNKKRKLKVSKDHMNLKKQKPFNEEKESEIGESNLNLNSRNPLLEEISTKALNIFSDQKKNTNYQQTQQHLIDLLHMCVQYDINEQMENKNEMQITNQSSPIMGANAIHRTCATLQILTTNLLAHTNYVIDPIPSPQQYEELLPKRSHFGRDEFTNKLFSQHPILYSILDLISLDPRELCRCLELIKSILVNLIGYWHTESNSNPNANPVNASNFQVTCKFFNILSKVEWMPKQMSCVSDIISLISAKDICSLLLSVWKFILDFPPSASNYQQSASSQWERVSTNLGDQEIYLINLKRVFQNNITKLSIFFPRYLRGTIAT